MADKYLQRLAAVSLFSRCSRKDLRAIAQVADEITVDPGRELVTEGDLGHEAFVIVDGTATVTRDGQELTTLGPGDPFGEMALIDRAPRNATVTASSPLTLLVIGQREFAGLMDQNAEFRRSIMGALAGRLREKDLQTYG